MKKWLPIISVLLVSSVFGFLLGVLVERNRNQDIPFDSRLWQVGHTGGTLGSNIEPFRHRMVNDLLKNHSLQGKSKAEIDSLLGEDGTSDSSRDKKTYYWLNQEYACYMCVDPTSVDNLVLEFNSNGYVERAYIEHYVGR